MSKGKIHYAWWILVSCCALQLAGQGILGNCAGIFYAPVAKALGVGRGTVSLYMTIMNVAVCFMLPFSGKYLQKCKVQVVLPICMTLMCVNAALLSVYNNVYMWYVAGAIQGLLGAFILLVPSPMILSNWFHKKTGFAIGLAMAFSGFGGIVFNPIISGALAAWGWRKAYLVYAALAAVVSLPFLIFVMRNKPSEMGLEPYGYDPEEDARKNAQKEITANSKGGVTASDALKSPVFYIMLVVIGLIAFYTTYYQHMSGFATSIGWTTVFAGTLVSAVSFGNMALKFIYGAMADKVGVKTSTVIMMVISAVSFILFVTMQQSSAAMYVGAVCFGATLALCAVGAPLLTKDVFGEKDFGSIFARMSICTYLVGAVGMSGIGFVYDYFGSYTPAFILGIICVAITLVFLFMAYALKKTMKWQA